MPHSELAFSLRFQDNNRRVLLFLKQHKDKKDKTVKAQMEMFK
jgi:hypothetical protein